MNAATASPRSFDARNAAFHTATKRSASAMRCPSANWRTCFTPCTTRPGFAAISRAGARRRLSYVLVPWLTGGLVFLFRLTSLRDLTNDHYMHLSWAQQVLLGSLPGRDFVDPGMPLAWGLSAIGQALSAGPFSEAVLSCAMFGLTAAIR